MILGITGAMRRQEEHDLEIQKVQDKGSFYLVNIPKTKNGKAREFVANVPFTYIIKKYIDLRPKNMKVNNFFFNYQHEKCTRQVIGKNKLGI